MLTFCSIVTPAAQAQARVMAASVRRHHSGARVIGCLRGAHDDVSAWDEPLEATGEDSPPQLLLRALGEADTAVYLAPEVFVCATLEPVWNVVGEYGVALLPRLTNLPEDGKRPNHADLLRAGRITAGCVAVRRGEPAAEFLSWWSRRIAEAANEERWLDLGVERLPGIGIITDPGCNVSYWNLHERPLTRDDRGVKVAGATLRFADFHGFRADRPYWLSDAGDRIRVTDDPVLSELCGAYAEELRAAGWSEPRRGIADIERLGNSHRVDHLVKSLWDQAVADGLDFGDPLNPAGADAFLTWVRGPAERGAAAGVNRYLLAAYRTRPDLQETFPDLDGPDGTGLVSWAWEHGRREVLAELLPPAPDTAAYASAPRLGVNVIGYLGETLGLAEAARLYIAGLTAAGVPVSTTAIKPDLPVGDEHATFERYGSHDYEDLQAHEEPAFNLACLNGDHLAELIRKRGDAILAGRPTIGQWGWETDVLPPSWTAGYEYVEECWVYSNFMAENLGRLLPMPVVVVPPAVVTPVVDPAELTIARDDRFTFLFMLDLFSTLRRKNALGLIEAFTRGFAPGEGPRLIIKTINARFREQAAEELRYCASDHPDVEFVDGYLEPAQRTALLARADCYVSLHRSEGFGLPLAEAMALGTPVIATGYSGNTDFTTPFNSYLVDWKPAKVGPDCEIYPPDGTWAEPDLDHAAELMRRVWGAPEEAAARARRAQAEIQRNYAPKVVGEIARARLERLSDLRAAEPAGSYRRSHQAGGALQRVERALDFDLHRGVPPLPGGPAGLLRKFVLRLILPFSYHERQLDRALLDAVRELQDEIDSRHRGSRQRQRDHNDQRNIEDGTH